MEFSNFDDILKHFVVPPPVVSIQKHGCGLINDTYRVDGIDGPFALLQRLNPNVFVEPEYVIENISKIVKFANAKQHTDNGSNLIFPQIYATNTGKSYFKDDQGSYWRLMEYIKNAVTYNEIIDTEQAQEAGRALGSFHSTLDEFNPEFLHPTLKDFHVTEKYLDVYSSHIKQDTTSHDSDDVVYCKRFINEHKYLVTEFSQAATKLKTRVIHGDPKLNNILFDKDSKKALCLIDLDTLMPGLVHYDIGDCVRSVCNAAGENPPSLSDVEFNLSVFTAFMHGYMHIARPMLTHHDIHCLFHCIQLLPYELGLRFFTDHLKGNVYFKVQNSNDNLKRAQVQFHLLDEIKKNKQKINAIIQAYC